MSERIRGCVIDVNAFGATVRLESGDLATALYADVEANRPAYARAFATKKPLEFAVRVAGRHAVVAVAPQLQDDRFEEQIAGFLKMTQEWEKPDAPPAHERHFLQKKRRAARFE